MKMKNLFIVLLLMTSVGTLLAQPENAKTEVRNGQTFYVHEVIQGNTLWGLQNLYKVSAEIIIQHNPSVVDGLKVGQLIYIPVNGVAPVKPNAPSQVQPGTHVVENVVHVVAGGETVYGISKKYNITPEQLLELNPEAKNGLSVGQVLLISKGTPSASIPVGNTPSEVIPEPVREPSTVVIFKDSLVQHRVMKGETLYSISKRFMVPVETLMEINKLKSQNIKEGDVLIIPLKKENVGQVPYRPVPPPAVGVTVNTPNTKIDEEFRFQQKNQLRIAVLLPIEYGKSTRSNGKTRAAIQFYAGVKMAIDTLGKMGLNAHVTLFDTRSDSATTVGVLEKMNESHWDLIIGPLFHHPANLVANWAKQNRIPLLLPTPMSASLLRMNPYVYMAIPTDTRIMEGMAQHIVQRHAKDNIILIKSGLAEDEQNYEALKNKINGLLGAGAYRQTVKEISGKSNLQGAFVKGMRNIYIMPSKNKSHVIDFWKAFQSFQLRNSDGNNPNIVLYGMREWEEWKELTREQKSTVNFHYAAATSWISTSGGFSNFARQYRSRFMAEPERLTVQGYDATHYFIRNYFMQNMNNYNAVINQFNYQSTGEGHGMENRTVFILRYEENKLIEVGRVQ
jgi:LysM repeat protein